MTISMIGLSPELFTTIFPFHLAFNRNYQLVQLSHALQQNYPDLVVGNLFEQHFQITCPLIALDFQAIQKQPYISVLLTVRSCGNQLKGQMLYAPEHEAMLFFGSPWVTTRDDSAPLNLSLHEAVLHDIALHKGNLYEAALDSPVADYLVLCQAQKTALLEIHQLVDNLTQQQRIICRTLATEQELNDMKSRFITAASHEFRTPLGIISSSAGILQDYGQKVNDELRQKHLLRIQAAVQHITALLEDVLLMNRLEQSNLESS
ncbi:MAG TPA: histidine kinase dimerization/phospho-acceptor domain-containing protein [Allocoleopsis sp.]